MADTNQVLAAVAAQAKAQPSPFDDDTEIGEPLPPEKFPGANDKVEVETRRDGQETEPLDIEVLDDRPEADRVPRALPKEKPVEVSDNELSQYSEGVQKRIRQMAHEYHTERRAREEQERQANEATRIADTLYQENRQLRDMAYRGRDAYYVEAKAKAEASLQAAKAAAKAAHESGDADAIVKAHEEVASWVAQKAKIDATVEMQQPRPQEQEQQPQQRQQPQRQQPQPQPQPEVSIETQRWMKENPWFGKERDASAFAMHLHQVAVTQEFLRPDTPEYFEFITQNTRRRFPEVYAVDDDRRTSASNGTATQRVATRSSVVAPVRRTSSGRKVQLTATQVSLARRLGITPEQYARELIKEQGA